MILNTTLFTHTGGTVECPARPLNQRTDGGHLLVNPPREVWERSELTPLELMHWSFLVAATGRAMLDVLPQLAGGCINYWEAGNWALNDLADPVGPKDPRQHRKVHLHVLGRSPHTTHLDWAWGESPRFPPYAVARAQPPMQALTAAECEAVVQRLQQLLAQTYAGLPPAVNA